jgi:acetyltransferase-like isoleucine patch superfamily enzyme
MNQLHDDLRTLRDEADAEMRRQWDRSLPFPDILFDRWGRAHQLGFGEGTSVYDSAHIFGSVSVGEGTWIGPFVILDGSGADLTIGNFCDISPGVHIFTHDTALRCVSLGEAPIRQSPVTIGDGTYIGSQSVVVAGTNIGSQCIVAANSLVNTDAPDRTIVAGTPAVPIGHVVGEGADVRCVFSSDHQ